MLFLFALDFLLLVIFVIKHVSTAILNFIIQNFKIYLLSVNTFLNLHQYTIKQTCGFGLFSTLLAST